MSGIPSSATSVPYCDIVIDGAPYHNDTNSNGSYISPHIIPMYIWIVIALLFGYEGLMHATNEKHRWLLISILTYAGCIYSIVMAVLAYIDYTKSYGEVAALIKGSRPCVDASSGKQYT